MKLSIRPSTNPVVDNSKIYETRTAIDTKLYDHRTHVFMKPDTYIGADTPVEREEWLYNIADSKMYKAMISFVPGCERIFLEILSNASDNALDSRRKGVDPGKIEIIMNNIMISITNYGLPMPVEMHPSGEGYVPQLNFGRLLTSRHYETERHEAGTNGIGSKATNIFSKEFMCIICDHVRHLKYTQTWTENMLFCGEPIIEAYTGKISSVQVIYKMDFERFGYSVQEGYPAEAFELFARHALDISFNAKTTVVFNGYEFNVANIRDYGRLYFGDAVDTAVIHYQWPAGTEIIKKKKGYQVSKDPSILPEVELLALDTPDDGYHVSFVNCMMTRDGGVHVNSAYKAVGDSTVKMINDSINKQLSKAKKGKELDAKQKRSNNINITDVKPHISILLSVKVKDPKFTSQSKTSLHHPTPKINVTDEELKQVGKWDLINRLYAAIEAKQFNNFMKNDGKSRNRMRTKKGTHANKKGINSVLYITEGDSGAAYVEVLTTLVPNGLDHIGILPMKGKSLNVMNATMFQINENEELNELNKMLGLHYGVDYLDDTNYNKLNYGKVMITADSDVDGKHIKGLILNYFHCRFPSLLARGCIDDYLTPIVSVKLGKQHMRFFSEVAYNNWQKETPNWEKWEHKYYKGLATSKDEEIEENYHDPRMKKFFYDLDSLERLSLAFAKGRENDRKDWIRNYLPLREEDINPILPISRFINEELILHAKDNVERTIPRLMDGQKEGHRKIMYAIHMKWKIGSKKGYKSIKVAQLGAFVAETTAYHHGEVILGDTIVGMAQDFIGSNNIAYLAKESQMGCFDPETHILMWNGLTKLAKDITINDILVGDDGNPRHISAVVSGIDNMYDIIQSDGETYRVNSQHILTLQFLYHKDIRWKESAKMWIMEYFDIASQKVKSKSFSCGTRNKRTREEGKKLIDEFASKIPDNDIFDINLQTYLSFSKQRKELFRTVRFLDVVKWPKREVPIQPYIFGMWLGDGFHDGEGFASADSDLIKEWVKYSDRIGAEVVHDRNNNHEKYQYSIRRRGLGTITPIGSKDHSTKTCGGCITSKKSHPACDWIYEEKSNTPFLAYDGITSDGMARNNMNPFKNILKANNLYKNKHIPELYMINDEETRLQLLAGLIDTDGCLKFMGKESQEIFEISQSMKNHEHIVDAAQYIAKSLGFKTHIYINESDNMKCLTINGNISRIPTKLVRKRSTKTACKGIVGGKFTIDCVGMGNYVGWHIDGNERFLHADFTVLHNTRSKLGKNAGQTRYTFTKPMPLLSHIFNKKDVPILTHLQDEGKKIEPEEYLPIIPMILVNGTTGIGTGWSTFVPNYNPLDLIKYLRMRLQDASTQDLPKLKPWYRNFIGTIEIIDRRKNKTKVEEEEEEEEEDETPDEFKKEVNIGARQLYSMKIYGKFEVRQNGDILVTELPIGRAPFKYQKWLETLVDEKKIKGFRNLSGKDKVYFEIHGFTGTANYNTLKLQRTMGMSNMVLLDENNKPVRYDTANEIIEKFYQLRLPFYQKRKDYMLKTIVDDIETLNYKARFIQAIVIDKTINVIGTKKSEVHAKMDGLGIPREIYVRSNLPNLSEEGIAELMQEINDKQNERAILEQITIKQMMLTDLDAFEQAYRKEYNIKKETLVFNIGGEQKQNESPKSTTPPETPSIIIKPTINKNPNRILKEPRVIIAKPKNSTQPRIEVPQTQSKTIRLKINTPAISTNT